MGEYRTQIEKLRNQPGLTDAAVKILDALTAYGDELLPEIQGQTSGRGETNPV